MNTLYITLARNDGKPDNRILSVLDEVKKHGLSFDTPAYYGGVSPGVCMTYTYIGKRTLAAALHSLESALGQQHTTVGDLDLEMHPELVAA